MKIKLNVVGTATIVTIILAGMSTGRCYASGDPKIDHENIVSYRNKLFSHGRDLLDIAKSTRSLKDQEMLRGLYDVAAQVGNEAGHLADLLVIKSRMRDEADKQVISMFIGNDEKYDVGLITLDIEQVNLNMANLKSPAGLIEASKLKDDLHALKELLTTMNLGNG
jgi:hypothetical protein